MWFSPCLRWGSADFPDLVPAESADWLHPTEFICEISGNPSCIQKYSQQPLTFITHHAETYLSSFLLNLMDVYPFEYYHEKA
ncbi:MAG: hypothetical protein IPM92_16465 [Saprospiraceae bacterium]|nr:hypothetical protein [Saprospiraceae bacterium]